MSEVTLTIDNKEVKAQKGMTVVEAARSAGIYIPTLCHDEKLKPYTACRICLVEVEDRGRTHLDTACSRPVKEGIVVTTRSEKIDKIRKTILELMMTHAPDSQTISELAKEYGADRNRFEQQASFCILCGLCVRYCAEVKGKHAVGFINRGPRREINFIPEVAAKECWNCKECFPLCPTSFLQATYTLTEGMMTSPPTH